MAIAYREYAAAVGTTSLSIDMPAGTAEYDIMIMAVMVKDTSSKGTPPEGWEKFAETTNASDGTAWFAWKRAGASEAGPYAVSGGADSMSGGIMSFSGCRKWGNPIGQYASRANASGASGTAGISTTEPNMMIVSAGGAEDDRAFSSWAATDPSTLTEKVDANTSLGSDSGIGMAYAAKTTVGATGATSYTITYNPINIGLVCSLFPHVGNQAMPVLEM